MNQPNETLLIVIFAVIFIILGMVSLMIYGYKKNIVVDERDKKVMI